MKNFKQMKKGIVLTVCLSLISLFLLSNQAEAQDFKIRGRLHMDAFYGLNDAEEFNNGFNNRRARLGAGGKMTENWDGRIEVDFANGGVSPNDFRMRRSFSHGGRLWIGQFKVPMGLNELTSSNAMTFIERSTVTNMIADSRRMGIAYELFGSSVGFKTMLFGRNITKASAIQGTNDMPLGGAFRGVFMQEIGGGNFHLGASAVYEDFNLNDGARFRDRPEARDAKGTRLLDIRVPDAMSTMKFGGELMYMNGPFSIEAEYLQVIANRRPVEGVDLITPNPSFFGYHVQAGYVFNGQKSYSKGAISGVKPTDESGAWEVALRYSHMDLNDGELYTGGTQSNVTFAINRYVTSRLRFMGNIILVNVDKEDYDKTPVLGVLRAQYNF